jgi:hypothetical protein
MRLSNEQPVFLPHRRRPDRPFTRVVVDLHPPLVSIHFKLLPPLKGVRYRFPKVALGPLKLLCKLIGSTPKKTRRLPVKLSMGERAGFAEGKINEQLSQQRNALSAGNLGSGTPTQMHHKRCIRTRLHCRRTTQDRLHEGHGISRTPDGSFTHAGACTLIAVHAFPFHHFPVTWILCVARRLRPIAASRWRSRTSCCRCRVMARSLSSSLRPPSEYVASGTAETDACPSLVH